MTETEIFFVMRSDESHKKGGDSVQIAAYSEELEQQGFRCHVVPFSPRLTFPPGSIVHLVNIDRIYDFLFAAGLAKTSILMASPIHHDLSLVRHMRRSIPSRGLRGALDRALPESLREFLAFSVRSIIRAPMGNAARMTTLVRSLPMLWRPWARAGRVLDQCAAVFLLAEGERASLVRDTDWSGKNGELTPNAVPASTGSDVALDWQSRSPVVLLVGRVEPRKRFVEIAEEADSRRIPIRVIGGEGTDPEYVQRFSALAARSDFVTWDGAMDHSDVLRQFGRHRVLLNPSWVEVQSLVDLEAALAGCAVVTTPAGYSHEWLPDAVTLLPTFDAGEALLAARGRTSGEAPHAPYAPTWKTSVEAIAAQYDRALRWQKGPH